MFSKLGHLRLLLASLFLVFVISFGSLFVVRFAPSTTQSNNPETVAERVHETPKSDLQSASTQADIRTDSILLIALILMAATTAGSVGISFYLYRWRRILSVDKRFSVPEELISSINSLHKEIRGSSSLLGRAIYDQQLALKNVADGSTKTDQRISEVLETLILLQRAIDERDSEIRRLRQGYDGEVFRRFVSRFIRVKQLIDDCHSLGQYTPEDCENVGRLLDDAFEECGVEQFAPQIGSDYRSAEGVADNPRVVHTRDPAQSFSIADIVQPGYRFREGEQRAIVVPARVSIFMAQRQAN